MTSQLSPCLCTTMCLLLAIIPFHSSHSLQSEPVNSINSIKSYRKLFTSSLAHVVWNNVNDQLLNSVSRECSSDLTKTIDGFKNNLASSYAFIDASSKFPSGILDGTVSSYGDYDQCLEQSGAFCMVRLRVNQREAVASTDNSGAAPQIYNSLNEMIPVFAYFYLNMGLCMPSSCSSADVLTIVNQTLTLPVGSSDGSLPLTLYRNIICDTAESIKVDSRLHSSQLVAASFICLMISLAVVGTLCSIYFKLTGQDAPTQSTASSSLLHFMSHNFCMISNSRLLVAERSQDKRINLLDYLRLTVIIAGIAGHCLACLETVPSWVTISRLLDVKSRFRLLIVQPLINEAGLGLVTFLGGLATYIASVDLISKGKFNYKNAVFDRWIRYMPSLMSMVAFDILWPLSGSGPLFTQIARHLLDKCTRYWWMNFLFINNFKTAPANCVPHTFYSSIDLQLYMIALLVVTIMVNNARLGMYTAAAFVLIGNGCLAMATLWSSASPVMIDAEATVPKTLAYLDYVHFATYGHFSNYMIGLTIGYLIKHPHMINTRLLKGSMGVALLISSTVHFSPALHNTYGLITPAMVPIYIVTVKFLYAFYFAIFVLQQATKKSRQELARQASEDETEPSQETRDKDEMRKRSQSVDLFDLRNSIRRFKSKSLTHTLLQIPLVLNQLNLAMLDIADKSPVMRFIINVSYSTYLINYAIIRWDFFNSRVHMDLVPMATYSIFRRLTYTLLLSWFMAYFFHIIFVTPFDKMRRSFSTKKQTVKQH